MAVSSNGRIVLGALTALALAGVIIWFVPRADTPEVIEIETDTAEVIVTETIIMQPRLDTVRVEADGTTVLAGWTEPMQQVAIVLDGVVIETVSADASGSFVAFPMLGFSDASRMLSLIGDPNGVPVVAADTYLIAPIIAVPMVADATAPLVDVPADTSVSVMPKAHVDVVPEARLDVVPEARLEQLPEAPSVLVAGATGVRVLQSGGGDTAPDVLANVALDSITYDPSGEVLIAGRAGVGGFVQVYLDNQPITTSRILEDGNWRTDLPDVDTGIYTLRVDEVNDAGEVVSRVETPFQREEPTLIAAQMATQTDVPNFKVAVATVQPGTSLWAIAQEQFGDGIMYVQVFEANRDRIRDPDLIYPGQVFRLPEANE